MGVKQALEVLGKALELANARHAFGLADASIVQTAYSTLVNEFKETPKEAVKESVVQEEDK
jgi:hypothetical protein